MTFLRLASPLAGLAALAWLALAQSPRIDSVQRLENGDLQLAVAHPAGAFFRLQASDDLALWTNVATVRSDGTATLTDTGTARAPRRHYRAVPLDGQDWLTGDHIATSAGDAVVHPINHASVLVTWNGLALYSDPVGGASPYSALPKGDVILVTHSHSDHWNATTLNAMRATDAKIIAPQAVYNAMSSTLKALTTVLTNGASTTASGMTIEAVPAYNANHPQGTGNGYVVTLGGKKFFFSGDTGPVAEIRSLEGIHVAFLCMNLPFTMSVDDAATTLREMDPAVVYPYHYRNQDGTFASLVSLRQLLGADSPIELRTRTWY